MRPVRLEVDEPLGVDVPEALRVPDTREIAGGKRGSLTSVVPAAEGGDQDGPLERRTANHPQLTHAISVRGVRQRAVTRPTVQAHTAAARADMDQHEPPRQLVSILELADGHLDEQQHEQHHRTRNEHPGTLAIAGEPAEQDQEGDPERGRRADVDVDGVEQVPEALDLGAVAGMRPGGGRQCPGDDEHTACTGEHEPRELEPHRRRRLDAAARISPGLDRDDHRAGEDDEREEEVCPDHQRVQVEPDRQEAERSLCDRAQEDQRCGPDDPAAEAGRLPDSDPRHEREHDRKEREDAVAELDRRVLADGREERTLLAAGPRLAGEARSR